MKVKFSQSARKHRIAKGRAWHVIITTPGTTQSDGDVAWLGSDQRGIELEIRARPIIDDKTGQPILLVIHVMSTTLRRK